MGRDVCVLESRRRVRRGNSPPHVILPEGCLPITTTKFVTKQPRCRFRGYVTMIDEDYRRTLSVVKAPVRAPALSTPSSEMT